MTTPSVVGAQGALDAAAASGVFSLTWLLVGLPLLGAAVLLLGVLPAVALIVLGIAVWSSASFLGALLVVIGALVLAIALLVSRALSGIFGVALYRYALDGEVVGGFTREDMESAVKVKGGRNAPPTATPGTV